MLTPKPHLMHRLLALALLLPVVAIHAAEPPIKWDDTDLGPFQTGTFKLNDVASTKGISISVGTKEQPAAMLFDPELLRFHAAWEGKLAEFPRGRGGLDGQINIPGAPRMTTGWTVGMGEVKDDPRPAHQGNLPNTKWRGLYLNGDKVVLNYTVGKQTVLEVPGSHAGDQLQVFTRTFTISAGSDIKQILISEMEGTSKEDASGVLIVEGNERVSGAALQGAPAGIKIAFKDGKRIVVEVPALTAPATFQIAFSSKSKAGVDLLVKSLAMKSELLAPVALTKPAAGRWGAPIVTKGKLGTGDGAYLSDEITLPEDNPYKSWMRPGGHDFFPDGTAAVVNISGDVWLVSGLDDKLESVKWKRFATGLFQPLGCKVVGGKIYVTCRDQITRLHDLNNDGEADFYENFNNDCIVTQNYHEFALDLQTDSAGNFYYGKGVPWTPSVTSPHQGTIIKVSKDGSKLEVYATGVRAPNGLGMGPGDILSASDNEGHWIPANCLNIIKKDGFYGMTTAAHKVITMKKADGTEIKANPSTEEAKKLHNTEFWGNNEAPIPTQRNNPLVWFPKEVDNSPGGEVWVPSGNKWGPWGGHMLHMSYGKCILYGVLMEKVGGVEQGAVVKFPFKFSSGIQRGRFSPKDGQLYMTGLNVWQSDAAKDGCFVRVRYTGKPVAMPIGLVTKTNGVEIQFTAPLNTEEAGDVGSYQVQQWNYKWTGNYGSPDFSVKDPNKTGRDTLEVKKATVGSDKKSVTLDLGGFGPAMQGLIKFNITTADGTEMDCEIFSTTHKLPEK